MAGLERSDRSASRRAEHTEAAQSAHGVKQSGSRGLRPYRRLKSAADVVLAAVALALLSPVLLIIAIAVKLDSRGPVLFKQERLGLGGRPFVIYKFRSMYINSPPRSGADGSRIVTSDDPRVTRVGRLLRIGLDELPQLVNVLRGEMSLVGPRADEPIALSMYSAHEIRKLTVKPGLIGLSVVKGRNAIPWHQRLEYDVEYAHNCSLWLDLRIMLSAWKGFLKP